LAAFRSGGFHIITFDRPILSNIWRKAWALPIQLRRHADALASLNPDAVIMTMNSPFAWPFIGMLQRRGLNVFYIAHDAEPHPGDYAVAWQRTTQDLLVRRADRIITLSASVAEQLANRIPASALKTTVVPLETVFPIQRHERHDMPAVGDTVRLLFYGRLIPYKGLDLLAHALTPLRNRTDWSLTIAGSGPLESEIRNVFESWPQVDLELGWISDDRTAELFSNHHLLLCPYVEASQSGVVAQALTWALPSLVMPAGALPDQIGGKVAGTVAEATTADAFRLALERILERPDSLEEFSRGAAKLIAERQAASEWGRLIKDAQAQRIS
jgi:glycosyltransferase involved in cell wall biosynthesis